MIAPLQPHDIAALAAVVASQGVVPVAAAAAVSLATVYRALRGETVQHTTRRALARAVARAARRRTTTPEARAA
jgi:DNA-binding phage protein